MKVGGFCFMVWGFTRHPHALIHTHFFWASHHVWALNAATGWTIHQRRKTTSALLLLHSKEITAKTTAPIVSSGSHRAGWCDGGRSYILSNSTEYIMPSSLWTFSWRDLLIYEILSGFFKIYTNCRIHFSPNVHAISNYTCYQYDWTRNIHKFNGLIKGIALGMAM